MVRRQVAGAHSLAVARERLGDEADHRPERRGSTEALSKTCVSFAGDHYITTSTNSTSFFPIHHPFPLVHIRHPVRYHRLQHITTNVWFPSPVHLGVGAAGPSIAHRPIIGAPECVDCCMHRACAASICLPGGLRFPSAPPPAPPEPVPPEHVSSPARHRPPPSASARLETYELRTPF